MSFQPPDPSTPAVTDPSTDVSCYAHRKTPATLRCTRCDRPICGRCAITAAVGQHCPECVAEARRAAPKVRTAVAATAPVILGIIAVTVVFYFAQQLAGPELTTTFWSSPGAIARGEWWRLLTPMLVHAGFLHIGMNMLVLYVYGPNIEQAFGGVRFIAMYLTAGFLGSAVSYAFGPNRPSVGASGAIFGVVGVLLVYLYRRRSSQFIAQYLRGIIGFLGLNLVLGFVIPNVDMMGHLGGLIGGVLLGLGFDRGQSDKASSSVALQVMTLICVTGLGVALVMYKTAMMGATG